MGKEEKFEEPREVTMLRRCVYTLLDYNIITVNETKEFNKRITEMPK